MADVHVLFFEGALHACVMSRNQGIKILLHQMFFFILKSGSAFYVVFSSFSFLQLAFSPVAKLPRQTPLSGIHLTPGQSCGEKV